MGRRLDPALRRPVDVRQSVFQLRLQLWLHVLGQCTSRPPPSFLTFRPLRTPRVSSLRTTDGQFTLTVNDTNPIWVYCATPGHCTSGMVMAINAPSSGNTFAAFQAAAEGKPLAS